MSKNEPVTFESLSARIYPADLDRVRIAFTATRNLMGPYEIDFRTLHDGAVRWVSARGQGSDVGIVGRVMFSVFLDVTKRKQAEEARELLTGEMSHRIKNLFAIASALTTIAARSATTTAEMARDLTQRLTALGRAHDLVRPTPGEAKSKAEFSALLTVLLAPYDDREGAGERVRIAAPELRVGEAAAATLALVVHELATNSVKYGALSVKSGTLDVVRRRQRRRSAGLDEVGRSAYGPTDRAGRIWQQACGPECGWPARRLHRVRLATGGRGGHAADEQSPAGDVTHMVMLPPPTGSACPLPRPGCRAC